VDFFSRLAISLELLNSGPLLDYLKVQRPLYKVTKLNGNNELFLKRKIHGPGPRVIDHDRAHGPRWTDGGAGTGSPGRSGTLIRARPSATPRHGSSSVGAQKR
jgi:hypothetical protein